MEMKYEDFTSVTKAHEDIIKNFPDDLTIIDDLIKDKDDKIAKEILSHLSTLLLNNVLNNTDLLLEEEMNYINSVRDYIVKKSIEITNKQNKEFLSKKGKLTPEQIEKYSNKPKLPKVDKDKMEQFSKKSFDFGFVAGIVVGFLGACVLILILQQ